MGSNTHPSPKVSNITREGALFYGHDVYGTSAASFASTPHRVIVQPHGNRERLEVKGVMRHFSVDRGLSVRRSRQCTESVISGDSEATRKGGA